MSSNKIIFKNTTGTDIGYKEFSIYIPASGQVEITPSEYPNLNNTEVITEMTTDINSGDIVINDGVNDLSSTDGLRLITHQFKIYVKDNGSDVTRVVQSINFKGSNVIVTDQGDGNVDVEPSIENALGNDLDTLQFGRNGVISNNTWMLSLNNIPSNTSPTVLAYPSLFRKISWSNSNNADTFTIKLYKASETNPDSRTLFYSETVSGRAGHTGADQNIILAEGQALSIQIVNVGNPKPSELVVTLWMRQG